MLQPQPQSRTLVNYTTHRQHRRTLAAHTVTVTETKVGVKVKEIYLLSLFLYTEKSW